MDKKMETTIMGLYRVEGLGCNGKEKGNHHSIMGFYWDT